MPTDHMSNYTKTTRVMLRAASEIGAKPFILFQYYLTWENAKAGIFPPLSRIAQDLGLKPNAICNLRKHLIDAGWIQIKNGRISITKSFTKNEENSDEMNPEFTSDERYSEKMNEDSEKMNPAFRKNESPLKGLDIKNVDKKKEERKVVKQVRGFSKVKQGERIFAYWQKQMHSPRSAYSKKRKTKIEVLLKTISYSDCLRAVRGCCLSDWHMGRDPNNQTLYNEFERIFKDQETAEKFINRYYRRNFRPVKHGNGTNSTNKEHANTKALREWGELAHEIEGEVA